MARLWPRVNCPLPIKYLGGWRGANVQKETPAKNLADCSVGESLKSCYLHDGWIRPTGCFLHVTTDRAIDYFRAA